MTHVVTNSDFKSEVLESSDVVLVDFFAPWCGPCQALLPTIDKMAKDPKPGTKIVKVNIDQSPELAQMYGVMSIPTLMVFKEGQVKDTFLGVLQEKEIVDMMEAQK